MARRKDKERAIQLRKKGWSYSQIKEELGVGKGTLSVWLRDYPLPEERIKELRDKNPKRIERYRNTMRKKREAEFQKYFELEKQEIGKLSKRELVNYNKAGVTLTENGEKIAASMIRNSRLLEVLMSSALKIDIDEEMVCGIEHHMNKQFTDALCTMLNHPRKCPHTHDIPMGECCENKDSN